MSKSPSTIVIELASSVLKAVLGTGDVKPEYRELAEKCCALGFVAGLRAAQGLIESRRHTFKSYDPDGVALDIINSQIQDIISGHIAWPKEEPK